MEHDIQFAELLHSRVNGRGHFFFTGNVTGHESCPVTEGSGKLGAGIRLDITDHYPATLFHESAGGSRTYSACAPGNQRCLVFQSHPVFLKCVVKTRMLLLRPCQYRG
jgi:hypothetical protein